MKIKKYYECDEYDNVVGCREDTDEQLISVLYNKKDKVFCRTNKEHCDSELQYNIADYVRKGGCVEISEDLFNIRYPLVYGEQYEQDIRDYANDFVDNNKALKELSKEYNIADDIIDLMQLLLVKGE